jgi:hypothetical protein
MAKAASSSNNESAAGSDGAQQVCHIRLCTCQGGLGFRNVDCTSDGLSNEP